MTTEYFNGIYEKWINSNNPTLLNLVWMLYGQLMIDTVWNTSDTKINDHFHVEGKTGKEYYKIENIDTHKTWENFKKKGGIFMHDIDDNKFIFFDDCFVGVEYGLELYTKEGKVPDWFWDQLSYTENVPTIKICSGITSSGIILMDSEIRQVTKSDIEGHYNDDLPINEIQSFISDPNDSGLVILHGNPGTGKTYFIRYLINENREKSFVFVDINDFYAICGSKQNLAQFKNTIMIIEDCEALVKDRDNSAFNQNISDLLNITDGLLGDSLNIKIICTFNKNVKNIDSALLRKGRIKYMYEFKELSQEKTKQLCEKLNVNYNPDERYLCDIYNQKNTGVKTAVQQTRKIGF